MRPLQEHMALPWLNGTVRTMGFCSPTGRSRAVLIEDAICKRHKIKPPDTRKQLRKGAALQRRKELMMRYKFWMVFTECGQSPNKQHFTQDEADAEAQRLAKKNGRPAYVLESVGGYEVPEPSLSKFKTDERAPQAA